MNQKDNLEQMNPVFFERVADTDVAPADLGSLGFIARHIMLAASDGALPSSLIDLAGQHYRESDAKDSIKRLIDNGFAEVLDSDSDRLYMTQKAVNMLRVANERNEELKGTFSNDTARLIECVLSSSVDAVVGVGAAIVRFLMRVDQPIRKEDVVTSFASPEELDPKVETVIDNMLKGKVLMEFPNGIWFHPNFHEALRGKRAEQSPKKVLEASITVCGLSMTYREAIDLVEVMEKFFMMVPFAFGELNSQSKDFSMTYRGVVFDRKTATQLGDEIRRNHVFAGTTSPTPGFRGPGRMSGFARDMIHRRQCFDQRDPNMTHTYGVREGSTTGPKF